jgi:type I restriction enzyme R subunit
MKFNEDPRVKIPSILHLMQLGCKYLSLKDTNWDRSTNIFTDIFYAQLKKINTNLSQKEAERFFVSLSKILRIKNHNFDHQFVSSFSGRLIRSDIL